MRRGGGAETFYFFNQTPQITIVIFVVNFNSGTLIGSFARRADAQRFVSIRIERI